MSMLFDTIVPRPGERHLLVSTRTQWDVDMTCKCASFPSWRIFFGTALKLAFLTLARCQRSYGERRARGRIRGGHVRGASKRNLIKYADKRTISRRCPSGNIFAQPCK